jgi:intein/homing endonuclease
MNTVDVISVSQALDEAGVWHNIQNDTICTRRTRIKIPKIGESVAYLAGVVTGDGSLNSCKRGKGGFHYRVSIVERKKFIDQLSVLIEKLFKYPPRIYKDKRKRNCYAANMYPAAVYFFFIQLGFQPGKKRNFHVPTIIINDTFLFKHYMHGLIDTDGSTKRKRVQLKQRDENFLRELVHLLEKHFDISSSPPRVNYTEGKPYYYIRFPLDRLTAA